MKKFRTEAEQQVGRNISRIFENCPDSVETKLENFPKYVRRQHLKRFLALYELFKLALPVKGSVVECGVFRGFGLMSWAKLSAMLEPENLTRRIYGFDSFAGFPGASELDANPVAMPEKGALAANSYDELHELIAEYDRDRFLGHIDKVHLVKGDVLDTIPKFVAEHPHLLVSLLFLDLDLYEPTKAAIEHFVPRMPSGSILAFDELDNPMWPGETKALLDTLGSRRLRLQRMEWDPYIAYAVL
ncbi:MAG: TylF/MycF family methyltransferase [Planctomycetes bacterium]|nr:TylF/MycF family methyltransferase [Planctomycetota bacterium]MBU4398047.1 TylF/MycF family methyltransferase [Planctomycetota bacterium]MCG2682845.1 TylF/MycF family methyltransferase [Planctomycetales bacterium]